MFTGLIQTVGKVSLQVKSLKVEYFNAFDALNIGDSVSVDGVCLTVVSIDSPTSSFTSDVSEETLKRTTLGHKAEINGFVNLEPALRLSDRLGGHLVSGHVDGLGKVVSIRKLKNSWNVEVTWKEPKYGRYICEKGSICIDGISLTVANLSENGRKFSVAVIPHTWMATSLRHLSEGNLVNLEADIMAKYAEKLLNQYQSKITTNNEITKSWLTSQGWI
tara:strand:- start:3501 stop:4157 length:657 start_codon:yes stop_codon:yes gene_type:complete